MMKLRKAARASAGKGRAWLASLAAVALVVGMVPASALAEAGAPDEGAGAGDPLAAVIEQAECSVPAETADTELEVLAWLNETWLPAVPGITEMLDDESVATTLKAVAATGVDGTLAFVEPVAGTESAPNGTDGSLKFAVQRIDGGEIVCTKDCTVEAKAWVAPIDPTPDPSPDPAPDPTPDPDPDPSPDPVPVTVGDFSVLGGTLNDHFTYADGLLTFVKTGEYTVSMAPDVTQTSNRIVVAADATVTLAGVNIKAVGTPIDVSGHNVTLTLAAETENTVENTGGDPGIRKAGRDGTLVVTGTGSLTARGGKNAAGIGGAQAGSDNVHNVRIEGGHVRAYGNGNAAGIGSSSGNDAYVTVTGGFIEAEGLVGIGGGETYTYANQAWVSIEGGTVLTKSGIGTNPRRPAGGVTISGGSVLTNQVLPEPSYEGKALACKEYQVKEGYELPLTKEQLVNDRGVPDYYSLAGAVPDENGKVYLWVEKPPEPMVAEAPSQQGDANISLLPYPGAFVAKDAFIKGEFYDVISSGEIEGVAGLVSKGSIESVYGVELTKTSLYDPVTLGGADYRIGDVLETKVSGADKTFVVVSITPAESGKDAFLNAVDVSDGSTWKVAAGEGGLTFGNRMPFPGVPLKQDPKAGFVTVEGVSYALGYQSFAGTAGYDEYSWHFLFTLDGEPAGYYHVEDPEGKEAIISGHFNAGLDPVSLKEKGLGVAPAKGQLLTDGGAFLALVASSLNISVSGVTPAAVGGKLGTLEVTQNAASLAQNLGLDAQGLVDAAGSGRLQLAGGHFAKGDTIEAANSCVVRTANGVPQVVSIWEVSDTSPFVTVALVQAAPTASPKQVKAVSAPEPEPEPVVPAADKSANKRLAATGDGAATGAVSLAALALAAGAALVLARRKTQR